MKLQTTESSRLVMVRAEPGEDLLEVLQRAVEESGIVDGMILNGVGSVSRYQVHVVETVNLPPGDVYFGDDGPFDILSVTGMILGGRVHAHITLSNTDHAFGGHLEPGCEVLTFAMVVLAETPDVDLDGWDRVEPTETEQ